MLRRTSCGGFIYPSVSTRWVLACVELARLCSVYSRIRRIDKQILGHGERILLVLQGLFVALNRKSGKRKKRRFVVMFK